MLCLLFIGLLVFVVGLLVFDVLVSLDMDLCSGFPLCCCRVSLGCGQMGSALLGPLQKNKRNEF